MKKGFLLEKKKRKTDQQTLNLKQRNVIPSEQPVIHDSAKENHVSKTDGKSSNVNSHCGWKKGFLNSSNPLVSPRRTSSNSNKASASVDIKLASSELLELENDLRDNSAWNDVFLKTKDQSAAKPPLILVQDDKTDADESKYEDQPTSHTKNPISAVISSVTTEEETPLIREISSRILRKSDMIEEKDVTLETHHVPEKESFPNHDEMNESSLPLPSLSLPTKLSILLSKLERLYQLKRRKLKYKEKNVVKEEFQEEKIYLDSFFKEFISVENNEMSQQSMSNIMFVFDNIFGIIPSYSKSQIKYYWDEKSDHILPPGLVLSLAIFDISHLGVYRCLVQFWSRSIQFLDSIHENSKNDQVKREKVKLIGSLICTKMKICSWHSSKLEVISMNAKGGNNRPSNLEIDSIFILLKSGIPYLSQLLESFQLDYKRTVLAVHALETAFFIIEDASLSYIMCHDSSNSSISLTIEDFLQVKTFLKVQEKWWLGETKTDESYSRGHPKRLCQKGILADWKLVMKAAEGHFQRLMCENNVTQRVCNSDSIYLLSKSLSGLYLDRGLNEIVSRSYGGIAQTMCKDILIANSDSEDYMSSSLNLALAYIHDSPKADGLEFAETAILRSVCFQMMQKCNRSDHNCIQSECFGLLIKTLKSKQKRSIDLTTSIIYTLWSGSGNTSDQSDRKNLLENSLIYLIDDLNLSSNDTDDPSETDTIKCIICVRIILDCKSDFLGYFLRHALLNALKIYAIFILLDSDEISVEDRALLEENLLVYLPKSKYLQRRIHSEDIVFHSIPTQKIIESMFGIMTQENPSSYLTSVVSQLFSKVIISRALMQHNELIEALVMATSKKREYLDVFDKHVRSWRRSLFSESCSSTAYQYILVSCARTMFHDPSNEIILNVLGGFVGSSQDFINIDESCRDRIKNATEEVLLLVSNELQRLNRYNVSDIFARLSPLLLLRRIPYEHFQFEFNGHYLKGLANELSQRLGLSSQSEYTQEDSTSSEERRLMAEVASRCFPFSSTNHSNCTGFSTFCENIIFSTFRSITSSQIACLRWKSIKVVLYIGCHLLQTSPKRLGNNEFCAFTTFVMALLNLNASVDDEYYNSMIEVHSGCIDFLASCISVPYMATLSPRNRNPRTLSHELVVEIDKTSALEIGTPGKTLDNYLKGLQNDMLKLIRGESIEYLSLFLNGIKIPTSFGAYRIEKESLFGNEWTSESRADLLNAFVIASQRCPQENILSFANSDPMKDFLSLLLSDRLTQPKVSLCTASALRFVFNILQRRKMFDVLHHSEEESRALAAKLFDLSLRITKETTSECDTFTLNILRKEGLKMLMVIISIDQGNSGRKVVTTGNLVKAMSALQEISNIDTDSDIRKFAQQLLSCVT